MDGSESGESLVGVVETTESWTIKAFSRALRLAVINAAKTEGVTTGQWLERVCRDRLEGGPVASQGQPGSVNPAGGVNLGELAGIMGEARAMAEAAGVPVPPGLAREAFALVKQASRQARGVQPRQHAAKAIAAPVEAIAPPVEADVPPVKMAKHRAGKARPG